MSMKDSGNMGEMKANLSGSGTLSARINSVDSLLAEMPFYPEILEWFRNNIEVRNALKIIVRDRFVPIHAISIVDNPDLAGVIQSIGIYSIDLQENNQIKQDFLMHEEDGSFVLFSGLPPRISESKYVLHIKKLKNMYGPDGINYFNDHHQDIEEVSNLVRPHVREALELIKSNQA